MKKLVSFFVIALFLSIPLAANATTLGTGYIDLSFSAPTGGGYYLDYDGRVGPSTFGYATGLEEVFCVSGQNLADGTFKFYTITNEAGTGLDAVFGVGFFAKMARSAWVGDNWTTYIGAQDQDFVKGEAQKAVWNIMGVMNILTGGLDTTIYNAAMLQNPADNYNWYFAYTPYETGKPDYQDYITPTPVPEPGILILLGLSMVSIGGLKRWWKE